ncbi:hypothetical protein CR513_46984, partial [Mucuna pruriens]
SLKLPSTQESTFLLWHKCRKDQEKVIQQESSSNQVTNDFTLFSINEMSMSKVAKDSSGTLLATVLDFVEIDFVRPSVVNQSFDLLEMLVETRRLKLV